MEEVMWDWLDDKWDAEFTRAVAWMIVGAVIAAIAGAILLPCF
jgi:hypothetical protein